MDNNDLTTILGNMIPEAYNDNDPFEDTFGVLTGHKHKLHADDALAIIGSLSEEANLIGTELHAYENLALQYFEHSGPLDFIFYGIRNVHTGDEEETRIGDMEHQDFLDAGMSNAQADLIEELLKEGNWGYGRNHTWHWSYYDVAYEQAIRFAIQQLPPNLPILKLARIWIDRWIKDHGYDEDDCDPANEFLDLYQAIYEFCKEFNRIA